MLDLSLLSIRALILGVIVFSTITHLPSVTIAMTNKIIISVVVVVIFALIDYFGNFLKFLRRWACKILCGCDPQELQELNDLDADVDASDETDGLAY